MGKSSNGKKRLIKKRSRIIAKLDVELKKIGRQYKPDPTDYEVICSGYQMTDKPTDKIPAELSYEQTHAYFDVVLRWSKKWAGVPGHKQQYERPPEITVFYQSYAWRKLRYETIKTYGRKCLMCGLMPEDGVKIHVDHIKPLKTHWQLRLDPNNVQPLCELCNHGKGNWDQTDWRPM